MNIVLKQKDADFILNYLRSDLQRINDQCDKVNEYEKKQTELKKEIEGKYGGFGKLLISAVDETIKDSSDEFHELYKQHTDTIIKCIGLLTIGSNLEDK